MLEIKRENFSGGLNLLLELIEKKKLEINNFSLCSIIDEYLIKVKELEKEKKEIGDFLIIISTLMLIKSQALIPEIQILPEEESNIRELKLKLQLYQLFISSSNEIKNIYLVNRLFFKKFRKFDLSDEEFLPSNNLTRVNLENSVRNLIKRQDKEIVILPKIEIEKIISIDDFMNIIIQKLKLKIESSFSSIIREKNMKSRKNFVVGFLALLELYKQDNINLEQSENFSDIFFKKKS